MKTGSRQRRRQSKRHPKQGGIRIHTALPDLYLRLPRPWPDLQLKKEHIHLKVVSEIDGIGRAVKDFTEKEDASFDLCVCGSRGMGSFKRCAR